MYTVVHVHIAQSQQILVWIKVYIINQQTIAMQSLMTTGGQTFCV